MTKKNKNTADRQPTELGELKKVVDQFVDRWTTLQNEMETLKEDEKNLIEEFNDQLDMKTLKQAIRAVKIAKKVDHKDTFDSFVTILEDRASSL